MVLRKAAARATLMFVWCREPNYVIGRRRSSPRPSQQIVSTSTVRTPAARTSFRKLLLILVQLLQKRYDAPSVFPIGYPWESCDGMCPSVLGDGLFTHGRAAYAVHSFMPLTVFSRPGVSVQVASH